MYCIDSVVLCCVVLCCVVAWRDVVLHDVVLHCIVMSCVDILQCVCVCCNNIKYNMLHNR